MAKTRLEPWYIFSHLKNLRAPVEKCILDDFKSLQEHCYMCDPNWETFQTLPHVHPYWRPVTPLVRVSGDTASGQEEGPTVPVDPPERQAYRQKGHPRCTCVLGPGTVTW